MNLSRRELVGLAHSMAGGLGFGPGAAKELAEAVAWLCERGLDGVGALAASPPVASDDELRAGLDGPGLIDLLIVAALRAEPNQPLQYRRITVDSPLLLIALCGVRSTGQKIHFVLAGQVAARICDGELEVEASVASWDSSATIDLACGSGPGATLTSPVVSIARPVLAEQRWHEAQANAAKTYVRSSQRSRTQGAGAGLTDND